MVQRSDFGRLLGHLCGVTGATIAIDGILGKFDADYVRLFPYGDAGFLIALFLIVLGLRVVSENLPRRRVKSSWWRS